MCCERALHLASILGVDIARSDGRTWQQGAAFLDTSNDASLSCQWRQDMAAGAAMLQNNTHIAANDPHYDAMIWPSVHPYGSGSLLCEPGAGGTQRLGSRMRLHETE